MYDIYDNDFDKAFDEAVEAIEKKEHRLIWADALKRHYAWWTDAGNADMRDAFDTIVDLQPTVDAEPTKHGRWKGAGMGDYMCSLCATVVSGNRYHYCPNCGAKMDEVETYTILAGEV